jgi:hypothetical protein
VELARELAVLSGGVRNNELQETPPLVISLTHEGVLGAARQLEHLDAGVFEASVCTAMIPVLGLLILSSASTRRRDARQPSGERALERSTVCRCSVRREHDLDRQREQRPQSLDDLLARNALR